MKEVVWADIDGTLSNCENRRHFIRNGNRDWPSFFKNMIDDPLIEPVAKVVVALSKQYPIFCCTGRGEEYRDVTEAWLKKHNIPYTELFMRPANDTRADHVVKIEMLNKMHEMGFTPVVALDDRASVTNALRQNGVCVLQCSDWDESKAQAGAQLDIMIGPSGSGKTTWLNNSISYGEISEGTILSSDSIRAELCGDFRVQTRNDDVHAAMHAIAKTRLAHGLSVFLDATHLRNKDRIAAAKLGLPNCKVNYWVINRPMEEKIRDRDWRSIELLERHENTFNSNLKAILSGDGLAGVEVIDLRKVG